MTKKLFSVYDLVAETIVGPILAEPVAASAIRAFHDALGMKDSTLASHPADFNLLELGEISSNGLILPVLGESPIIVATGSAWLAAKEAASNA